MSDIKSVLKNQFPFFVAVPALIWQLLFLYVPLFFILSSAFFKRWHVYDVAGFTLSNFAVVMSYVHMRVIGQSLLLAFCVACTCLVIGYPVAYFFALKIRRFKIVFLFFLTLSFWTNFLVQSYAWFFVLEKNGLLNTLLLRIGVIQEPLHLLYTPTAVVLVMVYCYLPFMILPLYGVLEKFDIELLEASADLGATPKQTFFKVTLPLTMSGIRSGFFLVFVPVFGEYTIPTILGGGKHLYVGNLISAYFLEARSPALGAAFTALSSGVVLVAVLLLYRLLASPISERPQE